VYRVGPTFVKTMAPTWDRGLDAEHDRLVWLATTAMAAHAPTVVDFDEGAARLVTTALAGVDAATLVEGGEVDGHDLARRMGAALREMHDGLDAEACPFDERLDRKLSACDRRIREGGVDVDDFEAEQAGRSPEGVLDELRATRPAGEDLVVTHGDWCWPNVVFDGDGRWGMVDVGALGVACRWYDVGIGCRSTIHNGGAGAAGHFLAGYGVEADHERMGYYVLLDELQ
jgi:aminoglycoside 3'-phosphotransferase-2